MFVLENDAESVFLGFPRVSNFKKLKNSETFNVICLTEKLTVLIRTFFLSLELHF